MKGVMSSFEEMIYLSDLYQSSLNKKPRYYQRNAINRSVKEILNGMSLYLGMEIPNWPPDNIAELSKKLEESI